MAGDGPGLPKLWRVEDLVERWGVSRETVLVHVRENGLPFLDVGTGRGRRPEYRFRPAAVQAWEAARERVRRQDPPAPPPVPPDLRSPGPDELLRLAQTQHSCHRPQGGSG